MERFENDCINEVSKMEKEEKKPRVDIESFTKGVSFITDIINDNKGDLNFEPTGVNFRSEINLEEIMDRYGLQDEEIDKVIKEVLEITNIVLSGKKKKIISDLEKNKPDILQTFNDRCKVVERDLVNLSLIQKYLIQTNYKTALLDKFDWDIIVKRVEHGNKKLDFPSAMIRLRVKKPFTDDPPVTKTETVVFEGGIDEIEGLINELNEMKKLLKKEEERLK